MERGGLVHDLRPSPSSHLRASGAASQIGSSLPSIQSPGAWGDTVSSPMSSSAGLGSRASLLSAPPQGAVDYGIRLGPGFSPGTPHLLAL